MTLGLIILAAGKVTRIRTFLASTPTILALIRKKVFLEWMIHWIESWEIIDKYKIFTSTRIGYQYVKKYIKKNCLNVKCVKEEWRLLILGAISQVAASSNLEEYLILNGDTIFKIYLQKVCINFKKNISLVYLNIKESKEIQRYGGYKQVNKGWVASNDELSSISMGGFFIKKTELIRRWNLRVNKIWFDSRGIHNKLDEEVNVDHDYLGIDALRAELLKRSAKFIDIGIPSSSFEAQKLISLML